ARRDRGEPEGARSQAPRRGAGGGVTYRPLPGDQAMDHASDPGGAKSGGNGGPFRLALPLYLGLLLVTAAIGIANQDLRARQVALVSDKTVLQASVARAEVRAAAVEGP